MVPILAEEAIEDIFPLPKQLVGNGTLFLLKVIGDSMINAAIADERLGRGAPAAGTRRTGTSSPR